MVYFRGTLFYLLVATLVSAQPLEWQQCVRSARQWHPDLVVASESLNQARSDLRSFRSDSLPSVNINASVSERSASGVESQSSSVGVSALQTLFDSGKTSSQIRSSKASVSTADIALAQASAQVRYDLRSAYIDLWGNQSLLDILEAIRQLREGNFRLVQLRYDSGTEHKGAFEQALAKLRQAEFELASAKRNSNQLRRELTQAIGSPALSEFGAVEIPSMPEVNLGDTLDFEEVAKQTLSYAAAQAQEKVAAAGVRTAKAGYGPTLSLSASATISDSDLTPDSEDNLSVGITASMPIFDFGNRSAALQKARSKLRSAQANVKSTQNQQIASLGNIWESLINAHDNWSVQEAFLKASQTRNKIANSQYEVGLISYDDWTVIEDAYVSAQKQRLNAQLEYHKQWAAWQLALGETL